MTGPGAERKEVTIRQRSVIEDPSRLTWGAVGGYALILVIVILGLWLTARFLLPLVTN